MQYITVEEFSAYIGKRALLQLTDSTADTPDEVLLEMVNESAAGEVDFYLRGVYSLPLMEPIDCTIRNITADIMKFHLYKRRDEKNMPDKVLEIYKLTIKRLQEIQNRGPVLDAQGAGRENVSSGSVVSQTPTQKFRNHFTDFDQ